MAWRDPWDDVGRDNALRSQQNAQGINMLSALQGMETNALKRQGLVADIADKQRLRDRQVRLDQAISGVGTDPMALIEAVSRVDPIKGMELRREMEKAKREAFAKVDPGKFTPESMRAFASTGDYTKLSPLKELHFADTGGAIQPMDKYSGAPTGSAVSKSMSPDQFANYQRRVFEFNNLSAQDRLKFENEAKRLGISAQELYFNTGMQPQQGVGATVPPNAQMPPTPNAPPLFGGGAPAPLPNALDPNRPVAPTAAPRAAASAPGRVPLRSPGDNDKPRILQDELRYESNLLAQAMAKGDQANIERGQANVASLERELQAVGVQSQSAPQPAPRAVPPVNLPGITPKQQAELNADKPRATAAAQNIVQGMTGFLNSVAELETHPGLDSIVGKINQYPALDVMPETRGARALQNHVIANAGVQVLQEMRDASKTGGAVGNVTEKEWPILQQKLAALSASQSTEDYKTALQNLQTQLKTSIERVKQAYQSTYGPLPMPDMPHARQPRSPAAPGAQPAAVGRVKFLGFEPSATGR